MVDQVKESIVNTDSSESKHIVDGEVDTDVLKLDSDLELRPHPPKDNIDWTSCEWAQEAPNLEDQPDDQVVKVDVLKEILKFVKHD